MQGRLPPSQKEQVSVLVFLARPAREKQHTEDKHGVHARRDFCTGLFARGSPGQLGNTLPFVGTEAVPGG